MASVRAQKSGKLYLDFYLLGARFRETTLLPDTAANRRRLEALIKKMEADILLASFNYRDYFPDSPQAAKADLLMKQKGIGTLGSNIQTLDQAANTWYAEHEVEWRQGYRKVVRTIINRHIICEIGSIPVDVLDRDDLVQFRNGRVHYRTTGDLALKPATVNRIMTILAAILEDASFRYKIPNPYERIKKLKEEKGSVSPFSLDEVGRILADVRADFRDYLIIKFFTGMRTGEVHGLRWKCVDFERGLILVRETFGKEGFEYTKNDHSQRDIRMSSKVREALQRQFAVTGSRGRDAVVFSSPQGFPIDEKNFCTRIWKPMLEDLDIPYRRPYDTRHTAATLMLAAGESPEWIANQLGHSNTKMLFSVYSTFVPNLTRNDGSAMDRLLSTSVSNL